MLVREAMNKNVKTARSDMTIKKAAEIMTNHRIGSLVVISGPGIVEGILTERDILIDVVAEGKLSDKIIVGEIMTKDIVTVHPDDSLEDAADLMITHTIKKLPVVEEGVLIGIITASDLVKYEKKLIEKVSTLLSSYQGQGIGG